jgi:hypothetical protein
MDDWHHRLVRDFTSETPAGPAPEGPSALEIALGQARSVVTYALELARAHRIAARGNVAGDDVWLQLGDMRARFTLNRRDAQLLVTRSGPGPGTQEEMRVHWDERKRVLVAADGDGALADVEAMARGAIDAVVAAWRARPVRDRPPSAPAPDYEDEPTKG